MHCVSFGDLRPQITFKRPTSQILPFKVFGVVVVVHNRHQNPSVKSISNIPQSSTNKQPSLVTADYLVNSCGLPPEKAFSAAKHFNLCSIEKADSVISLFQSYGLTETHITRIISRHPQLLSLDPNKNLKPKLEFLCDLGISGTDLSKFLSSSATFLTRSLQNQIIPTVNFLKGFIGTEVEAVIVIKRWPGILLRANLEKLLTPNISTLQVHGVPDYNISKMLFTNPRTLCHDTKRFKETVEKVKKLGFDPLSSMFCVAVQVMTGLRKSSWDKKLMIYREFGLLENDVISAFRKHPRFMTLSEEKIRTAMDFFLKKLKCKPTDISFCPTVLTYSLDKRIIPRCAVCKILYSKGIIKNKLSLYKVFQIAERDFSKKFVIEYLETVPEVMDAYKGGIEFEGFGEVVEVKDLYMEPVIDKMTTQIEGKITNFVNEKSLGMSPFVKP